MDLKFIFYLLIFFGLFFFDFEGGETIYYSDNTADILDDNPLMIVYGDIQKHWGTYSVKHLITTVNALKEKHGWGEYIPLSDIPRDSWEISINNLKIIYGQIPDVILFFQDYDLFNPEKFPVPAEMKNVQRICWYDDTPRVSPPGVGYALSHASLLLPTYEYLHVRLPEILYVPRIWMPHSALPNFELPFNTSPTRVILLTGMVYTGKVTSYPVRELIKNKIDKGDKRITQFVHPGWWPGSSMSHIDQFALAMNSHIACIMDASIHNFAIAKIFEVPATGSLLLITDDISDAMAALHFFDGINYRSFNRSSLDDVIDWVLDPRNALEVDRIRLAGQDVVQKYHLTKYRIANIHKAGLEAARVKSLLDNNKSAIYNLPSIQKFPNYEDWAWKNENNMAYYRGSITY